MSSGASPFSRVILKPLERDLEGQLVDLGLGVAHDRFVTLAGPLVKPSLARRDAISSSDVLERVADALRPPRPLVPLRGEQRRLGVAGPSVALRSSSISASRSLFEGRVDGAAAPRPWPPWPPPHPGSRWVNRPGHRVLGGDIGHVPMASVANRGDHVVRVVQIGLRSARRSPRVVLDDPGDSVGLVLALAHRGVAGP